MIDLTPLEVRQKKGDFRRSFRGYDRALVNDFLDLVADRMEELVKENLALQDRLEGLEEELEAFREKERALVDALMAAERLRDDARANAEKEAQLLFREAEVDAERHRTAAAQALAKEEAAIDRVRARRVRLVREFRAFLERELGELSIIEESLQLKGESAEAADAAGGRSQEEEAGAGPGDDAQEDAGGESGSAGNGAAEAAAKGEAKAAAETEEPDEAGDAADGPEGKKGRRTDWLSSLVEE